jgi:hypothetical protein
LVLLPSFPLPFPLGAYHRFKDLHCHQWHIHTQVSQSVLDAWIASLGTSFASGNWCL